MMARAERKHRRLPDGPNAWKRKKRKEEKLTTARSLPVAPLRMAAGEGPAADPASIDTPRPRSMAAPSVLPRGAEQHRPRTGCGGGGCRTPTGIDRRSDTVRSSRGGTRRDCSASRAVGEKWWVEASRPLGRTPPPCPDCQVFLIGSR